MLSNILRVSTSNVLKMFSNIILSAGCTFVVFHSHKLTGNINTFYKPLVRLLLAQISNDLASFFKLIDHFANANFCLIHSLVGAKSHYSVKFWLINSTKTLHLAPTKEQI